jgi:hypothetical protein
MAAINAPIRREKAPPKRGQVLGCAPLDGETAKERYSIRKKPRRSGAKFPDDCCYTSTLPFRRGPAQVSWSRSRVDPAGLVTRSWTLRSSCVLQSFGRVERHSFLPLRQSHFLDTEWRYAIAAFGAGQARNHPGRTRSASAPATRLPDAAAVLPSLPPAGRPSIAIPAAPAWPVSALRQAIKHRRGPL